MQELGSWLRLYQPPTGRRIFAHRGVLLALEAFPDLDDLKTHVTQSIAEDRKTRLLEMRWATAKHTPETRPAAQQIDYEIDRNLSTLHGMVTAIARAPEGTLPAADASRVLQELFPGGLPPIIHLSQTEELAAVEAIVERLTTDLAGARDRLHIAPLVDRLGELCAQLAVELQQGGRELGFDEVRAAQSRGQHRYFATALRILGTFSGLEEGDVRARAALLAPIWRQNEELRESRRNRREPVDIDPSTGEPIVDGVAGGDTGTDDDPSDG